MRILLIDSDKLFAATCLEALQANGHKARWASGSEEAISQCDKQAPDLIILEMNLPTHNGVEFLYELRSYPEWQNVRVVINSWVPRTSLKIGDSAWRNLNIYDYLYKPESSLHKLLETINKKPLLMAK